MNFITRLYIKAMFRFFPVLSETQARKVAEEFVNERLKSEGIDPDRHAFKELLIDREIEQFKIAAGLIRPE
jgi:hypothetical protein